MARWMPQYPINTNSGGDTVYDGFVKVNNETNRIYSLLNTLRTLRAGAIPPSDAEVHELWLDTSTSPPTLRRFDGTNWVEVKVGQAETVNGVRASSTPSANTIPIADNNGFLNSWIRQGAGSGLNADLVRGLPADFSSNLAPTGYQKLPSGLIIQWGVYIGRASDALIIGFPIAFPNACFGVWSIMEQGGGNGHIPRTVAVTTTGFGLVKDAFYFPANPIVKQWWIAIGY